jgi:hypothetical protein
LTIFETANPIVVFSVNRLQSTPTIQYLKALDKLYIELASVGINEVYGVYFGDFALFDFLMPKYSKKIKFIQMPVEDCQQLFGKRGHPTFLKDYWQFCAIVKDKQVLHYQEQTFSGKMSPDPIHNIYGDISLGKLLKDASNL